LTNDEIQAEQCKRFLSRIEYAYSNLERIDSNYIKVREKAKTGLADAIEEAKTDSDLSIKDIAQHFGKSRQAVNKVLTDVYGVRHLEKAEAAKIGHLNKESRENI
jgi:AraC-like DNA-binding protein